MYSYVLYSVDIAQVQYNFSRSDTELFSIFYVLD